MNIKYKGIRHNILNDAPFMGSIIIAPYCYRGCEGCHNEHLKDNDNIIKEDLVKDIIGKVEENIFDEGVILSGLEWTYSQKSMKKLIYESLNRGLKVMLYTYMEEEKFKEEYPDIYNQPIWVKFGKFDKDKKDKNYHSNGIKLYTKNQYVKFLGNI